MKKITVGLFIIVAVGIALTGCNVNIFAAMDTVPVPTAENMAAAAAENASGFIGDVMDYLDSGSITGGEDGNVDEIVAVLEDIYTGVIDQPIGMPDSEWVEIQQEAAVLAGTVSIESNPDAVVVVDKVIGTVTDMMAPDYVAPEGESETEALLTGLFPEDEDSFNAVYDSFAAASGAYIDFAGSIDTDDDGVVDDPDAAALWIEGEEKGDMVMYAVISIAVSTIPKETLYEALFGEGDIGEADPLNNASELLALLDFAGMEI